MCGTVWLCIFGHCAGNSRAGSLAEVKGLFCWMELLENSKGESSVLSGLSETGHL